MTLPPLLVEALEARFGTLRGASAVGGGCIASAARVETAAGTVFVEHSNDAPAGLFTAEARGLEALRVAGGDPRIPEVLGLADDIEAAGGVRWIALEWLEPGRGGPGQAERFGRAMARLHSARADRWGADHGGFIGSLLQRNEPTGDWASFWAERRLRPQLERAGRAPIGRRAEWERLLDRLPDLLAVAEEEGPSLLHGDLWSGNVLPLADGATGLVDPSCYYGHREVDLAMSDLFGGLTGRAREAYLEAMPLTPGYAEVRRPIYQLYYLLVHVNLFGGGYAAQTAGALRQALAA